MKTLILDASVAVAWYLPESFSDKARTWQRAAMDGRVKLLTPGLHFWEVANVIRTYVRRGELDQNLAEEIYALHLGAPIEVAEPDRTVVLETALRFDATAYDAVYIALSVGRDIPLLTAERTTRPWVTQLGDLIESVRPA